MALSFGESKRLAAKKAASTANASVDDNGEETFERSGNYT